MEKIIEPVIQDYEFIKDINSDIISAVYPMQEYLKKESFKRTILGGSPMLHIETGTNRFAELGVPAGLYLESNQFSFHNTDTNKKETNCSVIDETLFDKLLGSVSSVKPYSGTRKNYSKSLHMKTKKVSK
jgi:hypothetical protein